MCLGIFYSRVSPEALEGSFRWFPELGLGVHFIPSLGELVSSEGRLGGLRSFKRLILSVKAATGGSSRGVGSSHQVPWNSGSQPTKGGRLGS
jgi:hypothetical protein